ncbi:MAG: CRISPR-associated endonuclease Cas1, partial [Nitrospirae bacterium]
LKHYYGSLAPAHQIKNLEEYIKFQIGIFLKKKKIAGQLHSRKQTLSELEKLKLLTEKSYREYKKYLNDIIDIAWGVKNKSRPSPPKEQMQEDSSVRGKILRKKKEYYKKRILTGNIIVSTPGYSIGKRKGRIVIKYKRKVIKEIAASKVEHVAITTGGVNLSSNFIKLCVERKIPVDFFNFKGEPLAKLFLYSLPDTETAIAQLKAFQNNKSYYIAESIVEGKINNQINLLKYYLKYRKKTAPAFTELCFNSINKIENILSNISKIEKSGDLNLYRQRLMASEGHASSIYWDVIKVLLEDDVEFTGRVRKGATDVVNNALNYGYSMLYPRIWQALIQAGLNPMISYLHKEQENKPTLVFDLIEEFRHPIVDRTIFAIFPKGTKLYLADGYLTTSSKQTIIREILERLKTETRFRRHRMTYEDIIFHQAKSLSAYLIGKKRSYKPFVWRY